MNDLLRRQKVVALLTELDLQALLFCQPENLRYLCGFTGSDGALLVTREQLVFLTDSRYTTQAAQEVVADQVNEYQLKTDGIVAQLHASGATRIGFEGSLAWAFVKQLRDKGEIDWQWQACHEELQALRLHKSAEEIRCLCAAADLHVAALDEVAHLIRPGIVERDLALALEFALRKAGADEKAFDIIVASGVRGAMPHGVASGKLLAEHELVTIDFGCRLAGYHSDETVTLAIGKISAELRRLFDVVLTAHDLALAAVAPGIGLAELDRVARDYIDSRGYGRFFGHGLGHGIGLEVHEPPTVSPRSKVVAETGMVFTIEPGIYVPGVGGVRIEDMVLVTSHGHRPLTKIPKTFRDILLN